MNIKLELLKDHITYFINSRLDDFDIDANEIADSVAISILTEIQKVIKDSENTDFDVVEAIVTLFEAQGIDCGGRHDF
ncbi:MAG: hypothetical protein IJ002_05130 [Clostridia bacterium]|nr:hypothetical protein [Clostridia bacterium]